METKICATCKQTLDVTEFEFKDKKNNRRSSWCKTCTKAYKKKHYSDNKEKYLTCGYVSNHKRRLKIRRAIWEYFETHPCVDCGENDPIVLEFDHKDPELKSDSISKMITKNRSLSQIMQEVEKCDVRCANCHRRKTAKQFFWYESPEGFVLAARRKRRNPKKE
jgi:protein-arginine kinase activator protein McsA